MEREEANSGKRKTKVKKGRKVEKVNHPSCNGILLIEWNADWTVLVGITRVPRL